MNIPKKNQYIPDLTETHPEPEPKLELCGCGCGERPENCKVAQYEDERNGW